MGEGEELVTLSIGRAEALLLSEMLADFSAQPALEIPGRGERLAFTRLHGVREKNLVEPFMPNYRALVEEARLKLFPESSAQ